MESLLENLWEIWNYHSQAPALVVVKQRAHASMIAVAVTAAVAAAVAEGDAAAVYLGFDVAEEVTQSQMVLIPYSYMVQVLDLQ
jgi:hypothetical protein